MPIKLTYANREFFIDRDGVDLKAICQEILNRLDNRPGVGSMMMLDHNGGRSALFITPGVHISVDEVGSDIGVF